MAYAVAVSDSPLKGSSPVPVNAIVTAHDHMSAAAVTRAPASCSGAMNAGVPTATCPERPVVVMPGTAASPKSITTGPSGPRRTLPGLKSRCTMPTACTAPSAVSVATAIRSSAAPLRGPSCWTTSTSDGPLTYSLTMNGRRSKIPASRTCAVQNRATRCAAATSFRNLVRTCGSEVSGRTLSATRVPALLRARNTTPWPPSPRRPISPYPPTSRGSFTRRGSIPDIADRVDVTRPFCYAISSDVQHSPASVLVTGFEPPGVLARFSGRGRRRRWSGAAGRRCRPRSRLFLERSSLGQGGLMAGHPAIDRDQLPGDVAGLVRGEEGHQVGDIVWLPHVRGQHVALDDLAEIVGQIAGCRRGQHQAGEDGPPA